MDFNELIAKLRESREALVEQRDAILDKVESEQRDALTEDEETELRAKLDELAKVDVRLAEVIDSHAASQRAGAALERLDITAGAAKVRKEPLTYERHKVRQSYFSDLWNANQNGDSDARERLSRHRQEMDVIAEERQSRLVEGRDVPEGTEIHSRDLTTSDTAGGEFIPPLWMVDQYVEVARAGRPTADLVMQAPLPPGTDSINLPKISTGTAVEPQTGANQPVEETDAVTSTVTGTVQTLAGQQDVPLQLVEQSPIAFDQVIFNDLAAAHAAKVDSQVINGSGSSGQLKGILQIGSVDTTTYTDTTPTYPELHPKIADSLNQVATTRFMPPEAIVMHTRRFFWIAAQLDGSNRPYLPFVVGGPQNAPGVAQNVASEGPVANILGTPVTADPNVPSTLGASTNEDRIIVFRPSDMWLFEGPIRTRALQEVLSGTLQVRLQLYSYAAFIPDRYAQSASIVAGTGLAAPSF